MRNLDDVVQFMRRRDVVLVTAESCTAGLIAATLADARGAGQLLDCAFVVYSPQAKQRCLDVDPETLRRFNLTSEEVAREMAAGALSRSPATLAIANTGVADDTDETIPAGTQCFAWALRQAGSDSFLLFSETVKFEGERNEIREKSADYALRRIPHYVSLAGNT
ncbi:MAG: CinA family protein [Candidimonas sp.]